MRSFIVELERNIVTASNTDITTSIAITDGMEPRSKPCRIVVKYLNTLMVKGSRCC